MREYIDNLTGIESFYFYIALAGTTFFILQTFFTFIGFGDQFDTDTDFDGETDATGLFGVNMALHLFSLRGIVGFLMIFGWSGLSFLQNGMNSYKAFVFAFLAGFAMMVFISLVYYTLVRMGESGNVNMKEAIGKECKVYYPIPSRRSGIGKVHIILGGGLKEVEAITKGDTLGSGELVVVVDLIDDKLVVEKIG